MDRRDVRREYRNYNYHETQDYIDNRETDDWEEREHYRDSWDTGYYQDQDYDSRYDRWRDEYYYGHYGYQRWREDREDREDYQEGHQRNRRWSYDSYYDKVR